MCYHYTSAASAGLFSSVIAESPVCSDPELFISYEAATNFGTGYVKHIGCGDGGLLTLSCLRSQPTYDILQYADTFPFELHLPHGTPLPLLTPYIVFGPVVDGSDVGIVDLPLNMVRKGIFNKVPAVFGSNENEGFVFVPVSFLVVPNMSFPISTQDVINVVSHFFGDNQTTISGVLEAYPEQDYFDGYNRVADILRDYIFRCNIRQMARSIHEVTNGEVPTWVYRFNKTRDDIVYDVAGDFHGSELPFVFNHAWFDWKPADFTLSQQMGCYWASMARYGNPNQSGCANMIQWPENTGVNSDFNIVFDFGLRIESGLSQAQCDFWDTVGYD